MAIVRVDPPDPTGASLVQVDSSSGNLWLAIAEVDGWAVEHGFVRTNEFHLRQVLVEGHRRYRGICYRPTAEEAAAADQAQQEMISRADRLPERVGPMSLDVR